MGFDMRISAPAARGCLLGGLAVWAVSAVVAAAETPAAPAAQAEAREEVEEAKFIFDPLDRRDPFTYTKAIAVRAAPTGLAGSRSSSVEPLVIETKKKEAEAFCAEAETALTNLQGAQAVERSNRGLELFKDIGNIADYVQLVPVRDSLMRVRKAGERLRLRQDAERDFGRLNIRISGVVAREKHSQAIVNGEIVNKGDLIGAPSDANDAVLVENILPEQIIFLFRGYRFALSLSEIGR